jgi:hypothetical protein
MKRKHLSGLILTVFVIPGLISVFGCNSTPAPQNPPPAPVPQRAAPAQQTAPALSPFTIGILNRLLNEAEDFSIDQCQFFLSGKITLERSDEDKNQKVENGMAVFIDHNNRQEITVNDKTEGVALKITQNRTSVDLSLCFDQDDVYQLPFSATGGENSQFFLKFNPQNDPSSDARGNLIYGRQNYKLRFSGGIPHLMVRLTEKKEPLKDQREATGRRVSAVKTVAFEPPVPLTTDILNRMKRSADFSIGQYQFFLSGAITLERFADQKRVSVIDGAVIFEDNPTSWNISVRDRTEGVALGKIYENGDETELYICFDQNDRNVLVFSSTGRDPQFYLKASPFNDPLSDARGSLEYGGQTYRLRFNGGRPLLQISLKKEGGDTTDQHTVPGRRVQTINSKEQVAVNK